VTRAPLCRARCQLAFAIDIVALSGVLANLNVTISAAEIDEARREVWASFPREGMFAMETT